MTSLRAKLDELAGKATPGPIYADGEPSNGLISIYHPTEGELGYLLYGTNFDTETRALGNLIAALVNNLPTILSALEAVEWRSIETLTEEDGFVLGWAAESGFGITFKKLGAWATHWRPLGPLPEGE